MVGDGSGPSSLESVPVVLEVEAAELEPSRSDQLLRAGPGEPAAWCGLPVAEVEVLPPCLRRGFGHTPLAGGHVYEPQGHEERAEPGRECRDVDVAVCGSVAEGEVENEAGERGHEGDQARGEQVPTVFLAIHEILLLLAIVTSYYSANLPFCQGFWYNTRRY
ncbi:MAG: hypothetical protein HY980_02720 [Candidatus Magasanikbacteria bacterium]|nr:hypothetical protein [Candidatus Magasanikbacteria bacterium]